MTKSREPKIVRIESPGEGFREQVEADGRAKYARYSPDTELRAELSKRNPALKGEKINLEDSYSGDGNEDFQIIYVPMKRCPWILPGPPDVRQVTFNLWEAVKGYIYRHIDLSDERLFDILTAWVFASWIPEAWAAVPYFHILGPKASGKTRLLEVLQHLCYRGMLAANISEAALFRAVEKFHPTLLLDEAEIYSAQEKSSIQNLLNSGYRRGQYCIRVRSVENETPSLDLFDVYGFKAFAGTDGFKDTLESRAIRISMEKNVRPIEFQLDKAEAKRLRTMLQLWRFRRLSEVSEVSEVNPEVGRDKLPFTDGRFAELYSPLVAVANDGTEAIVSYARDAFDTMMDEEKTSIEAQILTAILEMKPELDSGKFSTSILTEKFNEGRSEREKWGSRSVGRMLKRLGFKAKRMTGGASGWLWEEDRVLRLAKRYALTPEPTSLTSLTSLSDICLDCGQPIPKGELILWKDQDPLCQRCAQARKKVRGESS